MAKPRYEINWKKKNKDKIEQPFELTYDLVSFILSDKIPRLEAVGYPVPPELRNVDFMLEQLTDSVPRQVIEEIPGDDFIQGVILGALLMDILVGYVSEDDEDEWILNEDF